MAPKKGKDKGKPKPPAANLKVLGPPPKPKKPPPPPACFTPEDLVKFKEMYKLFDEDNIDKVPIKFIPTMLRKLGFNPKGAEVAQLFKQFLEDDLVDTVEYHEWLFMIEAKMIMGDDFENEVTKAMAALAHDDADGDDNTTGFGELELIKQELMNWGEPLSELEFSDWLKIAVKDKVFMPETGLINYVKFIENMNGKDVKYIAEPINFFKLDQKTLAEMAIKKAMEEKAEIERREQERAAREEARRQKMIADGLILPD